MKAVAQMEPVARVSGKEFAKGEKDLVTQVTEFFAGLGNKADNDLLLGTIALDRRGAKADIGHGIGRKKAAAFAAVKEVLQQGKVIDYQRDWKGRGYDTAVIAAPVTIGGEPYLMGAVVIRNDGENRFYLHEVWAEKNSAPPFKTGTSGKNSLGTPGGDTPRHTAVQDRDLKQCSQHPRRRCTFYHKFTTDGRRRSSVSCRKKGR